MKHRGVLFLLFSLILLTITWYAVSTLEKEERKTKSFKIFFENYPWIKEWVEEIPPNSTIMAWWDYGKYFEKLGARSVVKAPSKSLLISVACIRLKTCKESDLEPLEPERKIKDVARFFLTSNESEAVCIAKKYNATYVFTSFIELSKVGWYYFALTEDRNFYIRNIHIIPCELKNISNTYISSCIEPRLYVKKIRSKYIASIEDGEKVELKTIYLKDNKLEVYNPENKVNLTVIIQNSRRAFLVPKNLEMSILVRLIVLNGYALQHFEKIHEKNGTFFYKLSY